MADIDEALVLLDSPHCEHRLDAVRRLAESDDARALPGLDRALNDSRDTKVVEAAALALLHRFDPFSMSALTTAFTSSDFEVSQTVSDVLLGAAERGRFATSMLESGDRG